MAAITTTVIATFLTFTVLSSSLNFNLLTSLMNRTSDTGVVCSNEHFDLFI
jgi:hypothetical protein